MYIYLTVLSSELLKPSSLTYIIVNSLRIGPPHNWQEVLNYIIGVRESLIDHRLFKFHCCNCFTQCTASNFLLAFSLACYYHSKLFE